MNRILHISRLFLVMLFALAPLRAMGASTTYYYAKVITHNTNTGAGTVYAEAGEDTGQDPGQEVTYGSTSNAVPFKLHATANEGYKFAGWSLESASSTILLDSDKESYTATVYSTSEDTNSPVVANYFAHWIALTKYYARLSVSADSNYSGTGTVKIDGANATSANGNAYGESSANVSFTLTAEPDAGCFFLGWEETAGSGIYVSTASTYTCTVTAASADEASPTLKQLYAAFAKRPSITIKVNGSGYGSGDNVVFNVVKTGTPTTQYTVPIQISSNAQVTLKDVPFGTYSVTPNAWGWNYTVSPVGSNTGVTVETDTVFEFNVVGKGATKDYDEKAKVNWGN